MPRVSAVFLRLERKARKYVLRSVATNRYRPYGGIDADILAVRRNKRFLFAEQRDFLSKVKAAMWTPSLLSP